MSSVKKIGRIKKNTGYKFPEPIPQGTILTDLKKQQWVLGKSIGSGGFGEIYTASPYKHSDSNDSLAVIKIEPHGNGPLFVEMHFYMRNANSADIERWKKQKKVAEVGIPKFIGSGSFEFNQLKYRFIIINQYGKDLWKLFLECQRKFLESTVYKIAWQIVNTLEYIHHKSYVHGDIKGGNLLLDLKTKNQIYLLDFGLASHYTTKDEYKIDPKKAHNGTVEYASRDAHMGVPTMRGDLEILLYNMIQWLCSSLPWEKNLKDPAFIQKEKEKAFKNINKFLGDCFQKSSVPEAITQFMSELSCIQFNESPDYNKFREILVKGLKKLNDLPTGNLDFSPDRIKISNQKLKKNLSGSKKFSKNNKSEIIEVSDSHKNDFLNSSIESIILDKKCMTGKDIRKKLMNKLDDDTEYEVQIKKKKN